MKIPRDCSGAQLAKALKKLGYAPTRQTGSHLVLTTQEKGEHHVTIPKHRFLKIGMIHGILKTIAQHHNMEMEQLVWFLRL